MGANRVVLFCVEEKPEACHRSIVTDKLEKLGYKIGSMLIGVGNGKVFLRLCSIPYP